ncbi:MAG: tyrosine-type recombinase/integrase [Planctomycetota bacterium]
MPWLRSRTERSSGITTWAIEWREGGRGGKVRARQLGAVTEKEAEFELAAMQAGKTTRREKRMIDAARAVEEYLRHLKASGRRDGTIEHDRDKLTPLVAAWSGTPLSTWSRTMLEGFLTDREWAPYRVRNALGVYRRFVKWCEAVGYVCGDFVAGFKPPRARPANEREALTAEQARKLLDAARGHYLEVPVALALLSGLSRADLRTTTWGEIDLDAGFITRPRHKTGTRLRLPISAPLAEVLRRHRQRSGLVCRDLPASDSSLYKALHRLCDRAGVPRGGWHTLRHTAATLLAAAGTDVATIGRILGHRPGSVVTLRYLHTDDDRLREAAEAVAVAVQRAQV